jgi:ketosteroid isomerase-like protein
MIRFMPPQPEQLHRRFQEAFNRQDLEAIVALYEPGAILAAAGGPAEGIDAIRAAYRGFLAMGGVIELQTLGVNRAGELALLHGKWSLRRMGADGSEIYTQGCNTEIARHQPDGRWLFVIDNPSVPRD